MTWESRNTLKRQTQMEEILNVTSLTDCEKLESGSGTRYSALAYLPYFGTIRMSIIGPIFFNIKHNLFHLIYFIQKCFKIFTLSFFPVRKNNFILIILYTYFLAQKL